MKSQARAWLGLAMAGWLLAGCEPRPEAGTSAPPRPVRPLAIDGAAAYRLVEAQVAIGPRHSGSAGAARTAAWLAETMRSLGYEPEIEEWTEATANGETTFRNVYARLPGKLEGFIIVGSHYDTKYLAGVPEFAGANDSASSTAVVLEMMRVAKAEGPWPGRELRFAMFDGEEAVAGYGDRDGLHGSRRLAGRLVKDGEVGACKAMILLDMVGDVDLKLTLSPDDTPELLQAMLRVAEERGIRDRVGFYRRGTILDDHVPFKKLGIPALDVIDFEYGPGNAWWHTGADTLDKVSPASLELVGGAVLHLLQQL